MYQGLHKLTLDSTYSDWATKVWDWQVSNKLIGDSYEIYDGASDTENCSVVDKVRYSYNQGIFLMGAAVMANSSNDSTTAALWTTRTTGLLNATSSFFKNDIMYEAACEDTTTAAGTCNTDQQTFKAYTARWMAATAQLVPSLSVEIMKYISTSASAAAQQCSGGTKGTICGEHWPQTTTYDGTYGVGQEMSALSIIQSNLVTGVRGLVTNSTGGTSKGDSTAGTGGTNSDGSVSSVITNGDRAGAGILTAVVLVGFLGGVGFLVTGV